MSDWLRSFTNAEDARSKAEERAARKRGLVPGSELTPAQLADMHKRLKAEFLEREQQRTAA